MSMDKKTKKFLTDYNEFCKDMKERINYPISRLKNLLHGVDPEKYNDEQKKNAEVLKTCLEIKKSNPFKTTADLYKKNNGQGSEEINNILKDTFNKLLCLNDNVDEWITWFIYSIKVGMLSYCINMEKKHNRHILPEGVDYWQIINQSESRSLGINETIEEANYLQSRGFHPNGEELIIHFSYEIDRDKDVLSDKSREEFFKNFESYLQLNQNAQNGNKLYTNEQLRAILYLRAAREAYVIRYEEKDVDSFKLMKTFHENIKVLCDKYKGSSEIAESIVPLTPFIDPGIKSDKYDRLKYIFSDPKLCRQLMKSDARQEEYAADANCGRENGLKYLRSVDYGQSSSPIINRLDFERSADLTDDQRLDLICDMITNGGLSEGVQNAYYEDLEDVSNECLIRNIEKVKSMTIDMGRPMMGAFTALPYEATPKRTAEKYERQKLEITDEEYNALKQELGIDINDEILDPSQAAEFEQKVEALKLKKCKEFAEELNEYAYIDKPILDDVLSIVQKYNKKATPEMLKKAARQNNGINSVFNILENAKYRSGYYYDGMVQDNERVYNSTLQKFESIFKKTRLMEFPPGEAFGAIRQDVAEKFDLKVWNKFANLPVFNVDSYSKVDLVSMISSLGLFEKDAEAEKRISKMQKLLKPRDFIYPQGKYLEIIDHETPIVERLFEDASYSRYIIRKGVNVPEDISSVLESDELSEREYRELRSMTGDLGKRVNAFLSPYAKAGQEYKLKRGVNLPKPLHPGWLLRTSYKAENFERKLKRPKLAKFLNPYEEVECEGKKIRSDLTPEDRKEADRILATYDSLGNLSNSAIHRMFDRANIDYNPEFANLLMDHFEDILNDQNLQSSLIDISEHYDEAKRHFEQRGNTNPTLKQISMYIQTKPFSHKYGNDEFAQEVKNAGVKSVDVYKAYEERLETMQERKETTLPPHAKEYVYTDKEGKKHRVFAQRLRLDDPMNMLAGEVNYTNCCQREGGAGHACMVDAATSKHGGIFATYLIGDDNVPKMLTQSWIWTNGTKICLDNVEATNMITGESGEKRKLYEELAAFAIAESAKDMLETSKEGVERYIKIKTKKYMDDPELSEEQKKAKLLELEEIRKDQTAQVVTVGKGYDDLGIDRFFKQSIIDDNPGPRGYKGYSDAKVQYVVAGNIKENVSSRSNIIEVPIFRDERKVGVYEGENIPERILKRVSLIEKDAHKKDMVELSENGQLKNYDAVGIANLYNCDPKELCIIAGHDWYYIYKNGEYEIEILDMAKTSPRFEDEGTTQQKEMSEAFKYILCESVDEESGKNLSAKPIKADLREDTSYILYLFQKRHGVIDQIGEDHVFAFGDENNYSIVTEEDQEELFKKAKQIRDGKNPDMRMHSILFKVSQATLKKIKKQRANQKT